MKALSVVFAAACLLATTARAAGPSDAPAGSMGLCKDGTYSSSAEKKGACRGHNGVKTWFGEDNAQKNTPAASERAPSPKTSSTATPMSTPSGVPPTSGADRKAGTPAPQVAAGGNAGKVWANMNSKVYHCSGDKYYGTTKHGEYLTEADAKAKGYHADHGKACT